MAASECGSTTLLLPSRGHHHRVAKPAPRPSTAASVTDVAVVSEAGSTAQLLPATPQHAAAAAAPARAHKSSCRHHPDKQYLRDKEGDRRERNLLIAAPTLQGLRHKQDADGKYREVPDEDHTDEDSAGDDEEGGRRASKLWPQVRRAGGVRGRGWGWG